MNGGKRPGAGRKKGVKTQAVLEREAVLRGYRQRVMGLTDQLLNSQLTLARGQTYLYKIEKELFIGPKGGKTYRKKKPELVTDPWELQMFLENKIGDSFSENGPEATYYYLTAKDPDGQAIVAMLDRTYGKTIQGIDLSPQDNNFSVFDEQQIRKIAERYVKSQSAGNKTGEGKSD